MPFLTDPQGRLITVDSTRSKVITANIAITSSAAETDLLAAGATGIFRDLSSICLSNKSASEVTVTIRDATTGGAAKLIIHLAASGGGAVRNYAIPKPQATAANKWTAQCSASVDSVYIEGVWVERP